VYGDRAARILSHANVSADALDPDFATGIDVDDDVLDDVVNREPARACINSYIAAHIGDRQLSGPARDANVA